MKSTFETKAEVTTVIRVNGGDPKTQYQEMKLSGTMNIEDSSMEMSVSGEVDSTNVGIKVMANEAGLVMGYNIGDQKMFLSIMAEDPETIESLTKSETMKLITEDGKELTIKFKTE